MAEDIPPKMVRIKMEDAGHTWVVKAGIWNPDRARKGKSMLDKID